MPIKTTAYKCVFKCGHKVLTKKQSMAKHESICFKNPDRKACRTCGNFYLDWDTVYNRHHGGNPGSSDYEVERAACCAIELINETISGTKNWLCFEWQYLCPLWQPKQNLGNQSNMYCK